MINEIAYFVVMVWLLWSVINQLIPQALELILIWHHDGPYDGAKAIWNTIMGCTKCLGFWATLICTGDLFLAASVALSLQVLGHYV